MGSGLYVLVTLSIYHIQIKIQPEQRLFFLTITDVSVDIKSLSNSIANLLKIEGYYEYTSTAKSLSFLIGSLWCIITASWI
jgi:hypothetical protein